MALLALNQKITWVGHIDFEITLLVADAGTGSPIPNASIDVHALEGGFCDHQEERRFTLVSGPDGTVKHLCKKCMWYGTDTFWKDSFGIHFPSWTLRCSANGFVPVENFDVREAQRSPLVRMNGYVSTIVRIELHKQ